MRELSVQLKNVVERASADFASYTDAEVAKPIQSGGWSRKQVLGHLIDSASNNHQRFVRALLQDELKAPDYDQPGCFRVQRHQEAQWADLVELWTSYNRFLAHVIAGIPESKLKTVCYIGHDAPATLEEVAVDYLRHMQHHLEQIRS